MSARRAACAPRLAAPAAVGLTLVAALLAAAPARADPNRFAVVFGANAGDVDEVVLRYAESDAVRVARVLSTLGGFPPENVVTLEAPRAAQVRQVLAAVDRRVRELPGEALLVVYYSGHADAEALHLGGSRLPLDELRELVTGSAASARVLVLDACRSGAITRVKGGSPAPAFAIDLGFPVGARGVVLLSSSAAGESAQESDALGASFFTHALVSALRGAGDVNRDGAVTLAEAFAYAQERTLTATSRTVAGPQHPTFRFALGGREDLVLTRPGVVERDVGTLTFSQAGVYVVHRGGAEGPVVAEVASESAGGRVALDAGRYFVSRRAPDHLEEGRFDVAGQRVTTVTPAALTPLAYARVVRKGGTARRASGSLFADVGVRGALYGLGTAWATSVGGRLDLRQFSLALRLAFAQSEHENARLRSTTRELGVALDALRAFDLGPVTLDAGLELGGSWFAQAFHDPAAPDRDVWGPFVGAVGLLEVPLPRRFYLRIELAGLFYFVHASDGDGTPAAAVAPTYRAVAGLGFAF